jgi:hypothetical protein
MKNTTIMIFLAATLAFFVAPANAAVTTNESTEVSFPVFVPCANETVDFDGTIHTLVTETMNGNNVRGKMQINVQSLTGIGEISQFTYQANGFFKQGFKMSLKNGQANEQLIINVIVTGPSVTFTLKVTAHITFNADGTVTAMFDNFSAECSS